SSKVSRMATSRMDSPSSTWPPGISQPRRGPQIRSSSFRSFTTMAAAETMCFGGAQDWGCTGWDMSHFLQDPDDFEQVFVLMHRHTVFFPEFDHLTGEEFNFGLSAVFNVLQHARLAFRRQAVQNRAEAGDVAVVQADACRLGNEHHFFHDFLHPASRAVDRLENPVRGAEHRGGLVDPAIDHELPPQLAPDVVRKFVGDVRGSEKVLHRSFRFRIFAGTRAERDLAQFGIADVAI